MTTYQNDQRQVKGLEDVVLQFTLGRGDVLLATSIIENGIDMPNVNSIVVMVSRLFHSLLPLVLRSCFISLLSFIFMFCVFVPPPAPPPSFFLRFFIAFLFPVLFVLNCFIFLLGSSIAKSS